MTWAVLIIFLASAPTAHIEWRPMAADRCISVKAAMPAPFTVLCVKIPNPTSVRTHPEPMAEEPAIALG